MPKRSAGNGFCAPAMNRFQARLSFSRTEWDRGITAPEKSTQYLGPAFLQTRCINWIQPHAIAPAPLHAPKDGVASSRPGMELPPHFERLKFSSAQLASDLLSISDWRYFIAYSLRQRYHMAARNRQGLPVCQPISVGDG